MFSEPDVSADSEPKTPDEAALELAVDRLVSVTSAGMERQAQLTRALQSRIAIEQAKGVLAERLGLSVEAAFDLLRGSARHHGLKIHDLAAAVVSSNSTPAPIEAMLERRR